MLNKKILIPIALLTTAIFAIGYGIATKYEPLTSLFNSNIYDTTETDMPPNFDGDASQMFNERGFYKSNSTSFDENEIISDFNGNLMYEIPLYKFKGNGDVNLDLNLVYNGSVNHQIIMATENYFVNNSNSTRYNISSPEWMISLNGICIQTLNFESFMLTDPTLSGDINGNRIKKLIPGYHYDDRLRSAGNGDKDRIYILMGDGSSLTLVNKNTSETGGDAYTGTYYADSKESHIKAFVYYDETDSGPYDYKNRYVELMMGDGLIYKFREYKRNFNDISTSEGITASRPQILLLQQIFDMYGHSINVTYGWNSLKQFGRPLLQSVGITNQTIDFEYGMYWGMCLGFYMRNYAIGNYKFRFNEAISFDGEGNKTASLQDIVNPVSQTARILYDNNYLRSLLNLTCQGWQTSKNIRFGNMNRISSFTNFMGGTRKYKYFGTNQADINFAALINGVIKSSGTDFQGNGRDAFFVNMIDTLGVYDKNQVQKSKQSFSYYYADNGTTYTSQEIDSSDIYSTTRQIISRDANTVNNSENSTSIKEYRYYPVKEYGTRNIEEIDISAVNKIIKDSVFNTNGSYQSSDFIYETGAYNSPVFNGSFLLLTKADTVNGKSRFTNYIYKYFEPNGTHNKYDSLVIEKVEIDPLGYKTSVEFMNFDETVDFYRGWAMLGAYNYRNTTPPPDTISVLGQKLFYKSGLPLVTKRYNNTIDRFTYPLISDLLLKQQTNEYITSENNSLGYIGELISTKDYAQGSTNTYIETKYEYYKKDTTGRALYSDYKFPYVEGNLKKTIFPENKEEKYFYYLVTKTDTAGDYDEPQGSAPSPKVYYKIKYNTGNELLTWNNFQDTRLPVKIDNYKVNSSSRDTLKVVYMSYNALGNPTMMVNQSGYLTTFDYDNTYNRIYKITLPGDYSTNLDRDTMYAVPSYYYSPVSVYTEGWGALDNEELDHTYNSTCASSFNLKYNVDNTSAFKIKPFMKFTQINLSSYTGIDSAIITLSPQWYTARNSSGVNIETDYEWRFKAVTQVGDSSITSCEVVSQDPVLSTYSILAPFSTSLYRNYNDQGRNCESYVTHNLRIESLLNNLRTNSQKFYGLLVDYKYTGIEEEDAPPNYQFRMIFTDCNNFNYGEWADLYKPKLTVYGQRVEYDTVRTKIYYGGTYIYEYDDLNRTTTIKSRFNHSSSLTNFKKVKYNFDGFGNIKEKDVYTSSSAFDDYNFAFNFMNQPAENIDARNNSTKLSYDYLGRQKKTLNADNSFSTTGYEYVNTVSEYFSGTYSGLVEKQTYTDETNRSFTKYFDAVGNLLREEKTVAASSGNSQIPAYEDQPYDPDTTYEGQDAPANWLALRTDYKYDELYRLTDVKTPGGKLIKYYYDAYGRQSQRNTPDAGTTRYSYDNNGNLILSQDANQYNISTILNSRRTYDGLNRLVSISDYKVSGSGGTGPMGDTLLPFEFDTPPGIDSIYIINVYDTLTTAVADIFNSIKPSDYNTAPNYTRGNLVATAYRTVLGEDWGYKFYRYDERGNFTKMWHYIVGLGWKAEMYYHNSQSQLTRNWYQPNQGDGKLFTYGYDDAGRLDYVNQYMGSQPGDPENEGDYPSSYFTLTKYTYDENSQVDLHKLNDNTLTTNYNYNNRNWIFTTSQTGVSSAIFRYTMLYNANGNIRKQISLGTYRSNFSDNSDLWETYIYDNSNRLLKADRDSGVAGSTHDLINGYDKDGNFQGMKRYGSANNLADDFSYSYYSGTNKLQRVTGTKTQYTYDDNGNMTKDDINRTSSIKYDHRNLMTEIRVIKTETPSIFEPPVDVLYLTQYKYDEAGNRVRKTRYKYTGSTPDPVFDLTGDAPPWILQSDEFYVRDVTGKEIAIYSDSSLTQWNIWGLDNIGKINADTTRNYYLKDHLGSIRVVLNSTNTVISAQDYDAWGYPLENRTYNSSAMKYDFTGKERDDETSYDYFGARYYDSRIGRWGQVEPMLDKHTDITPYCYSLCSPILAKDVDGRDAIATVEGSTVTITVNIYYTTESDPNFSSNMSMGRGNLLEAYTEEANRLWNQAGQDIIVEEQNSESKFNVVFDFKAIEVTYEQLKESNSIEGYNVAIGDNDHEIGVRGNVIEIGRHWEMNKGRYRGSHEMGHIMGLKHPYPKGSKQQKKSKDIMGYNKKRHKPKEYNVRDIIKKIDLNKKGQQIIKGVYESKPKGGGTVGNKKDTPEHKSDSIENVYKIIHPLSCINTSPIFLEKDSLYFEGFMIFKVSKNNNNDSVNTNFFFANIFWMYSLDNFQESKSIYYCVQPTLMFDLYINKWYQIDTSYDFMKIKSFHENYKYNYQKENAPFLKKSLTTQIFQDSVCFVSYDNLSNEGYYIFKISFYTAMFYTDLSCTESIKSNEKIKKKAVEHENARFLIPISPVLNLKAVPADELKPFGFEKATWSPNTLFK